MLEKLKGTFDKSVAAVSVKSESLVESSRTRSAISNSQKKMESDLNALAIRIYNVWKAGGRSLDVFEADFASIQATEQEIASLQDHLEQIKREENRILGSQSKPAASGCFCSSCGKALPSGSRFCDDCGSPVAQGGSK